MIKPVPSAPDSTGSVDARSAEREARFRLLFERSADAILLLDTQVNKFVEYNPATLEMLRCTQEELLALHPSELSPPTQPDGQDSFSKANEMIATAIARGSHRFEWIHRSPHRPDFPVEVLLTPISGGGAPVLMVVWRDISERKRAEEALRKAQKLESLGVLAGGIAHDFNNLLTAMSGHLALARAALPPSAAGLPHLAHVETAVQKAAQLTRQMLAYSGKGTFVVEPLDLGRAVREMADLLTVSVPKGVQLVYELPADLPAVTADATQLEQVIMNLVTNAAEAIGADAAGTITLRTGSVTLDEAALQREYVGQALRPGAFVTMDVQDTGSGMTAEVLARIFDPFFSTKQSGRGLGLSALLGIVKAHKGGVHLRSQPGAGTTFRICLPAAAETAMPVRPRSQPLRPARGTGTVLLVEDEPAVRRSTRGLLEQLGFTVREAVDGAAAVEVFTGGRADLRFVLMDLTMPRMDGHAAFLALQRLDPAVKVILTSGWAESDLVDRFHKNLPAGFLCKPFNLGELAATLRQAGVLE